ncbi:Transcription factor tau subunit sfc1 [Madurella mycetomatis]|uniref:Transcription factor tau subunit sfc1 n=1 Tax=Madurella mycetomatis TaxID=100816 RepID=A0A175VN99_9PEZI|nr:Transcription factor tau subunit sfc1 [Madurella mycetomatis]
MASPTEEGGDVAPTYTIPPRRLGALEHPMIIKNLDKGIRTLGQNNAFQAILDSASPQISVPLYLRHDNPTARPLTSHNALTHNVVLKITVPKRTGRKRKRGSDGPWEGEIEPAASGEDGLTSPSVFSRDRHDAPRLLRRKLQDNVGKYQVEPIGIINNTHRYRGLADFQYALGESKFMSKFVEKVLPGDVAKLKEFTIQPGIESGTNIDLVPPPYFTPMTLPFGYNYAQNPHTKELSPNPSDGSGNISEDQEYGRVVNVTTRVPAAGYFIAHDEYPVPSGPRRQPDMSDPQVAAIITEMRLAMEERPIWTRRSMWNRLGSKFAELPKNGGLVRHCLQYAGYQFKGGPWRDALVKYGLDPRSDPKYRIYQTLIFKLHKTRIGSVGRSWQAVRRNEISVSNFGKAWQDLGATTTAAADKQSNPTANTDANADANAATITTTAASEGGRAPPPTLATHMFNGASFSTDGKVWQVCDITDPLLARLFTEAHVRETCDVEVSGFYHRVLWSVAKAIMKCKMLAIRFGRTLTDDDFAGALEVVRGQPLDGGDGGGGNSIGISLPDLQLTAAECEQLRGGKANRPRPGVKSSGRDRWEEKRKKTHYRVRIPLKESEDREAVKMRRLLTQGVAERRAAAVAREAAAAATVAAEEPKMAAGSGETGSEALTGDAASSREEARVPDADETGDAPSATGGTRRDAEGDLEGGNRDEGAFQEFLDDMDEEGSEDEDKSEDEDDEEEDMAENDGLPSREKVSFQENGEEEEEEEYDEEEERSSDDDEEEEDENEGEYGHAENEEDSYSEDYYDEGDGGFPQPWEDEEGYDED